MIWNKGVLCTGLSTGAKNSGHSSGNGMVFKTLPTTKQKKEERKIVLVKKSVNFGVTRLFHCVLCNIEKSALF